MTMMAPVEDPSANNRRPSELNAATDLVALVGLSSPSGKAGEEKLESKEGPNPIKVEPKEEGTSAAPQGTSQASNGASGGPAKPQDKDDASGGDDPEKTAFPLLLHEVVSDPATDACIHWLACGTRFMISDKKKFARDVLPRFYGNAKFTSFTRRLKRWSFTRVPSGPFMGAYYNPHFQRGAPELAARVRYDHPGQLSGAMMQLNKAKLQAMGQLGGMMGGVVPVGFVNPFMMGGMVPVTQGQDALLLQMNANGMANGMVNGMANGMVNGMVNGMGMLAAVPGAAMGQNANLESLYLAMQQNAAAGGQGQAVGAPGNIVAANNNIALQMAMAQAQMGGVMAPGAAAGGLGPMDQARLLAQQQQMQQLGAAGIGAPGAAAAPVGQGQTGQQAGQGPEDQRLLAAMFLERLNKQNQPPSAGGLPQQNQPQQNQPQQNQLQQNQPQPQNQQNQAPGLGGNNFQGSSAPSLASITPTSSVNGGVNAGFPGPQAQNGSGGTLFNGNKQTSTASLTTLSGGSAPAPANPGGASLQLSYPGTGNAAGGAGAAAAGPANPGAMNALLADYLRRTGGAAGEPAPVRGTAAKQEGKGDIKTEASC